MPPDRRELLLSDVDRLVALRTFVGFDALGDEALIAIASLSARRQFSAGTTILRPGDERKSMLLLLAGDLHVVRMGRVWPYPADRRVLDIFWLARDTMPLEVRTSGGAHVLEFPLDGLDEILEEHFAVWLASAQMLSSWLLNGEPPSPERRRGRRAGGDPRSLSERIAALQEALPFARGYVDALMQLDEEATEVRYDAGELLWRPGDAADSLLVPLDGELRGVAADEPVGVGGLEVLGSRFRSAPLEVVRPLVALRIRREALLDLVEDHHDLARDLLATIAASVVQLVDAG